MTDLTQDLSSIYAEPNNLSSSYAATQKSANEYETLDKSANGYAAADKSANGYAPLDKSTNGYAAPEKSANGYAAIDKTTNDYATPANDYATPTWQEDAILNSSCQTKIAVQNGGTESQKWNRSSPAGLNYPEELSSESIYGTIRISDARRAAAIISCPFGNYSKYPKAGIPVSIPTVPSTLYKSSESLHQNTREKSNNGPRVTDDGLRTTQKARENSDDIPLAARFVRTNEKSCAASLINSNASYGVEKYNGHTVRTEMNLMESVVTSILRVDSDPFLQDIGIINPGPMMPQGSASVMHRFKDIKEKTMSLGRRGITPLIKRRKSSGSLTSTGSTDEDCSVNGPSVAGQLRSQNYHIRESSSSNGSVTNDSAFSSFSSNFSTSSNSSSTTPNTFSTHNKATREIVNNKKVRRCKSLTRPRVPPPPPPVSKATTPVPPNTPLPPSSIPAPPPLPPTPVPHTLNSAQSFPFSTDSQTSSLVKQSVPHNTAPMTVSSEPRLEQPTLSLSNTSPQTASSISTPSQSCSSTVLPDTVSDSTRVVSSVAASCTPVKMDSASLAKGPIPPTPPRLTSTASVTPSDATIIPNQLDNNVTALDSQNSLEPIAQSSHEMLKDESKETKDHDKVILNESKLISSSAAIKELDISKPALTTEDAKSLSSFTTGPNRMSTFFSDNSSHLSSSFSSRPTMPTSSFVGLSSLPKSKVDHSSTTFSMQDTQISDVSTSAALLSKSPSTSSILDSSLASTSIPKSSSVASQLTSYDLADSSGTTESVDQSAGQPLKSSDDILTHKSSMALPASDYALPRILSGGGNRDSWGGVRSPSPPPLPTTSPPLLTPPSPSGEKEGEMKILFVKKDQNEVSSKTEVPGGKRAPPPLPPVRSASTKISSTPTINQSSVHGPSINQSGPDKTRKSTSKILTRNKSFTLLRKPLYKLGLVIPEVSAAVEAANASSCQIQAADTGFVDVSTNPEKIDSENLMDKENFKSLQQDNTNDPKCSDTATTENAGIAEETTNERKGETSEDNYDATVVSAYETTTADETEMKLLKYKLSQIPDINESVPSPTREISHEKETKSHEYLKNDYTILATEVLNKISDEGKCALLDTTTKELPKTGFDFLDNW